MAAAGHSWLSKGSAERV